MYLDNYPVNSRISWFRTVFQVSNPDPVKLYTFLVTGCSISYALKLAILVKNFSKNVSIYKDINDYTVK